MNEDIDGPSIWCDCKGEAFPLMGRAMVHVLIEELARVGITTATITPLRIFP